MDFKFAFRSLRRTPGFSLLAVLVMALGIGANTAVFSVVNAVLLKPLAYHDPDRIVTLSSAWQASGDGHVSAPDFHDWHDQNTVFESMAYYGGDQTAITSGLATEYGQGATVTPEFFRVFDVKPALGRFFSAEEETLGGPGATVISHSYWQRHFAGNTNVLGQSIRVLGKSWTIVGVLPPGFLFPYGKTDVWIPANTLFPEQTSRSAHNWLAVGRLKAGASMEQAQTQMISIAARLEQQYPQSNHGKSVRLRRLRDEMVRDVRRTLYVLLGTVGIVLLIACANVANLLLAKATARSREIAIRAAVGASRARIVRQLLTESLVLAGVGGAAGIGLAVWIVDALRVLAPQDIPRLEEAGVAIIGGQVLAFTFAVSIVSSLLFGLVPALYASRADLNQMLKRRGTHGVLGGSLGRMGNSLVVVEIALSAVLLAGAGLLIKSMAALNDVALGFRPAHVLVMATNVQAGDDTGAQRATRFYKTLLAGFSSLPGVSAVGATRSLPGQASSSGSYWIDHMPPREEISITAPQAVLSVVAPNTFAVLGIPLKQGRDFNGSDTREAPFTAVINETLARQAFPGQDPVGRTIFCFFDLLSTMKIVGMVGDVRQYGPAHEPSPEIYMPYEQHPRASTALNVVVRTYNDEDAFSQTLRRKLREQSSDVPAKFTTMDAVIAEEVAAPRFRTLLLGAFAALALCLAMAGVYAVIAYAVGQRSNEIGLRMALGATSGNVLRLVLKQGMSLIAIGLAVGLGAAAAATRMMTGLLFEVKPGDPLTYVAVAALLGGIAMAAVYIPARRASKVDPFDALRGE